MGASWGCPATFSFMDHSLYRVCILPKIGAKTCTRTQVFVLLWHAFIWRIFLEKNNLAGWLWIWRENLGASENGNFHQPLSFKKGSQLNVSSPKKSSNESRSKNQIWYYKDLNYSASLMVQKSDYYIISKLWNYIALYNLHDEEKVK